MGSNGVPNEVKSISVEGDFITGGFFEWPQTELAGLAMPGTVNSSVFQVEISGCEPVESGDVEIWIVVEASGTNAGTYSNGFPTNYPDSTRKAFLRSTVLVSPLGPQDFDVYSITPDSVPFWGSVDDAIITGSQFENGATVELRQDSEPPVVGTDVVFVSSSELTCDFDLTGANSGLWDVVVINPSTAEGVLEDGFTIEVWSDELLLDETGNRIPLMAETSAGSAVLAVGCDDNNMRYIPFEDNVGWGTVDILVYGHGGYWLPVMTSDPVNDNVYLASNLENFRYTGNTGVWDYQPSGWSSARAGVVIFDLNGKMNWYQNTSNAFGHLNHSRASGWAGTMEIYIDNVMDGWNINVIAEGNIVTQNSSGTIFLAYERDWWLNQYGLQQPGPRWVKVAWIPLGGMSSYNYSEVDVAYGMDPLDSISISCDSNNVVHAAYRRWKASTSTWQVVYKKSTNNASSWGSESVIYDDVTEPEDGYVFLMADSQNAVHVVYNLDGEMQYVNSSDGATWSDVEVINESSTGSDTDITPRLLVTSDGIAHVAWIREDTGGYGDVYHRMRDCY